MSWRWEYRVAVSSPDGVLDWTVHSDDPKPTEFLTGATPGLLLDGLKLVRKLPEDEPWPCQPSATTLTFQVAAATAAELSAQLVKGAPVAFRIGQLVVSTWALADWFTGYISNVELESRGGYTVAMVTCLDWITQLGEVVIGDEPWPLEGAQDRISRVFTEVAEHAPELPAGWDYETPADAPAAGWHVGMAAVDVDARPALEVLLEVLGCWATGTSTNPSAPDLGRYQLVAYHADWSNDVAAGWLGPGVFTDLLTLDGFRLRDRTAAPNSIPPALFQLVGTKWGVVMSPMGGPTATPNMPAASIELPVRWNQRIGDIPNTAVVVSHFVGYAAGQEKYTLRWALPQAERRPRVRIARTVPLEFSTTEDATYQSGVDAVFKLAMLLIPNTINPRTSWVTDELTWRADMETAHRPWPFVLGSLITITGVDPHAHPADTAWIHGQLSAYTATITDGLPVVDFTLRPQLRDTTSAYAFTLGDFGATNPKLNNLDPKLTLHDLRLLRSP